MDKPCIVLYILVVLENIRNICVNGDRYSVQNMFIILNRVCITQRIQEQSSASLENWNKVYEKWYEISGKPKDE